MYLQNKSSVFDIMWNDTLTYGENYHQNDVEQSKYNFEVSNSDDLFKSFELYQKEVDNCVNAKLVLPAYDYVLKCSHTFNLLDARGVISKDERNNFIGRVRTMASSVAKLYVEQRKAMGFPLCKDNCHSELGSESICKR
jgi:glycyl-tRNA synthetase alpha chain